MDVLVIDIGGSSVKFKVWGQRQKRKFPSGPSLTPMKFVESVLAFTAEWKYDAISIGFPGLVLHGKPAADPPNLGPGWLGFQFQKSFKNPVQIINDAAMQALGGYTGGRMLFLGLGTGLGSTLILDDVVVPLELGELSYGPKKTLKEILSKKARKKLGAKRWERAVHRVAHRLAAAFRTDYIVLGGGNAKKLTRLPRCARRGSNDRAFMGDARLWGLAQLRAKPKKHTWVLV